MYCQPSYVSALGITENDFNKTYKVLSNDDLTAIYNKVRRRKNRRRDEKEWLALKNRQNRLSLKDNNDEDGHAQRDQRYNDDDDDDADFAAIEYVPPKVKVAKKVKSNSSPEHEKEETKSKHDRSVHFQTPMETYYSCDSCEFEPVKKYNDPKWLETESMASRAAYDKEQEDLFNQLSKPIPSMPYIHAFNNIGHIPREQENPRNKKAAKKVGFNFPEQDVMMKNRGKLSIPAIYGVKKLFGRNRGAIRKKQPICSMTMKDDSMFEDTFKLLLDFIDLDKLQDVYKKMITVLTSIYESVISKTDLSREDPEKLKAKCEGFITRFTSVYLYPIYHQKSEVKTIMDNLTDSLNTTHPDQIVHRIMAIHLLASQGLQALNKNMTYILSDKGFQPQFMNFVYCIIEIFLMYMKFFGDHPFGDYIASATVLTREIVNRMEYKNAALNPYYISSLFPKRLIGNHNERQDTRQEWDASTSVARNKNESRSMGKDNLNLSKVNHRVSRKRRFNRYGRDEGFNRKPEVNSYEPMPKTKVRSQRNSRKKTSLKISNKRRYPFDYNGFTDALRKYKENCASHPSSKQDISEVLDWVTNAIVEDILIEIVQEIDKMKIAKPQ